MAKKNQSVPKNFEEGMHELEAILSEIERGEMGVEDSLVRYERGTFLIKHCRSVLNRAQEQIESVSKSPAGMSEPQASDTGDIMTRDAATGAITDVEPTTDES